MRLSNGERTLAAVVMGELYILTMVDIRGLQLAKHLERLSGAAYLLARRIHEKKLAGCDISLAVCEAMREEIRGGRDRG